MILQLQPWKHWFKNKIPLVKKTNLSQNKCIYFTVVDSYISVLPLVSLSQVNLSSFDGWLIFYGTTIIHKITAHLFNIFLVLTALYSFFMSFCINVFPIRFYLFFTNVTIFFICSWFIKHLFLISMVNNLFKNLLRRFNFLVELKQK